MSERIIDINTHKPYSKSMAEVNDPKGTELHSLEDRKAHLESIDFSGFSEGNRAWLAQHRIEGEDWTKGAITAIGLPVENIRTVIFTDNTRENYNTLGSWGVSGKVEGEYRLYKLLKDIPPIAQIGTMSHELAHANTPFDEKNDKMYGSTEAREQAAKHAEAVASQTIATRVFLNPYHRNIFDNFEDTVSRFGVDSKEAKAARKLFNEETHAIMLQLRFENPKHLAQVEEAQHASLERRRNHRQNVPEAVSIVDGVNETLISLIHEVKDAEELDAHIKDVRTRFAQDDRSDESPQLRTLLTFQNTTSLRRAA